MKYLVLIAVIIGFIGIIYWLTVDKEHPSITNVSIKPDELLEYASEDIRKNYYGTSLVHIQKAINMMRLLEKDADSMSIIAIEKAIVDLEIIEKEIAKKNIDEDQIYQAFVNALNSLAFAELRISEEYTKIGKEKEAGYAMGYAIRHLQTARHFAKGEEKNLEEKVYLEIDSLMNSGIKDSEAFISELNRIILEIDTGFLEAYH